MNLGLDSAKFPLQGAFNFGPYGNRNWTEVDDLYKYYGDPLKPDGPERFVDSWRHIHRIFDSLEVKNAIWVWCPNHNSVPDEEWNKAENYYPGDHYVDWVGCDLYNKGYYYREKTWWIEFNDLFKRYSGLEIYVKHSNKPFMLAELGCSQESLPNVTGPKGSWITNAYHSIKNLYPNIKAVIWFSKDLRGQGESERDWRVDSSQESLEAYKKAISDPYFLDRIIVETSGLTSSFATFLCVPELRCLIVVIANLSNEAMAALQLGLALSNLCVIESQSPYQTEARCIQHLNKQGRTPSVQRE